MLIESNSSPILDPSSTSRRSKIATMFVSSFFCRIDSIEIVTGTRAVISSAFSLLLILDPERFTLWEKEGTGLEALHENSHRWRKHVGQRWPFSPRLRLKMIFRWRADNRQRTAYRISRSGICVPGGGGGGITYRRVQTKGRGEAAYIAKRSSLDLKYVAINGHNHYRFD